MKKIDKGEPKIEIIKLTLGGELMEEGSINYKTLIEILEGTVGTIESSARVANYKGAVSFNLQPPKLGSFEISLQVIDWLGGVATLLPNAPSIKDVISFCIEYFKIKKALKGEPVKRENIQTIDNGSLTIKDNTGRIVYEDHRRIVNINLILSAQEDSLLNKKIDKMAKAIEENTQMDTLSFLSAGEKFEIAKNEAEYYKYHEIFEQEPDTTIGYIRKIDNKTHKGVIVVNEGDRESPIEFEVDIIEISQLEKVVSNLAHAEADKTRVIFRGQRVVDAKGKLRKIIVNDVDIPDGKFGF